jgi:predicted TIM-barrel fold metal-dependent hydrolase
LPDWEEDLRRCAETHQMPGIRLHPNYHGYRLDHPAFAQLLSHAAARRLVVTLALLMEDERMMHPVLRVPPVDPSPLADLVARTPGLRLALLNALALSSLRGERLRKLLQAGDVYVEISMLEGVGGLTRLLNDVPLERILFGSFAPCFYFESALFKLKESPLTPAQLRAVREQNARRLLGPVV